MSETSIILWWEGWLKPKALTGSHGISKVKPPKAGIVLRWVTFLALDSRCSLPPVVHPIRVGYPDELDISTNYVGT